MISDYFQRFPVYKTKNLSLLKPTTNNSSAWIPHHNMELYAALSHYSNLAFKAIDELYPMVHFNPDPLFQNLISVLKIPYIKVTASDKNQGLCVWDVKDYDRLAINHLNDRVFYVKILDTTSKDLQEVIQEEICSSLDVLITRQSFKPTFDDLKLLKTYKSTKLSEFHILPKIHKGIKLPNLPIRPIVAGVNCPTTLLSKWLACRLNKLHLPTVLKNSYDLVQQLHLINVDDNLPMIFFVFDFTALYTNIELDHLYEVLTSYIHKDIADIAKLTCNNNFFTYRSDIYKQIKGIAMGTNAAVHLANIYLFYVLDIKLTHRYNSSKLFYRRYIDDGFGIWFGTSCELESFFTHLKSLLPPGLNITYQTSNTSVDFLDITIYKGINQIEYKTFQKESNKYQYLIPSSCHPQHTFQGYIKGELIRYKRLNSMRTTEDFIRNQFYTRLLARGFTPKFLNPIFLYFPDQGPKRVKLHNRQIIPLTLQYNRRTRKLKKIIRVMFNGIKDEIPDNFQSLLVYKVSSNISNLTVRSKITLEQENYLRNTRQTRNDLSR